MIDQIDHAVASSAVFESSWGRTCQRGTIHNHPPVVVGYVVPVLPR